MSARDLIVGGVALTVAGIVTYCVGMLPLWIALNRGPFRQRKARSSKS